MLQKQIRSKKTQVVDGLFIVGGLVILGVFTTRYLMPFRLDDVLHMDWARERTLWDAFDVTRGEIVRSVRPMFAITIWLLTHTAGIQHYFPWHFVLVASFLIGLAYTGRTARYLSGQNSALYFTTGYFWIAFLPILNVLFWYGDLTFTIELMFVTPAWYYGLKGLREANLKLWIIGLISGVLAVLSKEPAILLVHGVLVGTAAIDLKEVLSTWKFRSRRQQISALAAYVLFLIISLKLYFASPTRSNRFFDLSALSQDKINFFVNDRLRYYADSLLNPLFRLLLVTPIVYGFIKQSFRKYSSLWVTIIILLLSAGISFFLVHSILILGILLLLAPVSGMIFGPQKQLSRLLLPFSIAAIIILAVLLITVMLVKTQLTELSFVLLVISGVYSSLMCSELFTLAKPYILKPAIRIAAGLILSAAAICGIYLSFPLLQSKQQLLSDVRDVRSNANDAIKWMGTHLPPGAKLLVTGPALYGLGGADEMTSKDDKYKLYAQYTFLQGYIRSYFRALGREDISLGYLEDSLHLQQTLDACRTSNQYYLFLQTGLDVDRFHGFIHARHPISEGDVRLEQFSSGPYPSEIWKLGGQH